MKELFNNNRIAVHTPTLEDYIDVVQCALDNGAIWNSGCRIVHKDYWSGNNTYVMITRTIYYRLEETKHLISYGDIKKSFIPDLINVNEYFNKINLISILKDFI